MAHQTRVLTDPPLCRCHGEPMVSSGKWQCRIKRRASNRANYEREKADPRRLARKRGEWRRADAKQRSDPLVRLERQFREMTRIRTY